ncbi:isoamyl acetate-hydrolyzing esterase 1 homolog [Glandiceps talaboti]
MYCRWPKVVLFGDAVCEHSFENSQWGAILQNKLQRRCDVVNRGYAGYNSEWARIVLPELVNREIVAEVEVAAMVIFLGTNDSTTPGEKLHVPIETYKQNLQRMIDYLKSVKVTSNKLIFVSPPPVNENTKTTCCHGRRKTDALAAEYSEACCNVAKDAGIEYINLYHVIRQQENWTQLLNRDGITLSLEGGQFLERQLWPLLERRAEEFELKFPDWEDFEKYNPSPRQVASSKMIKQLTIEDPVGYIES